ncbi:MAG TPA: hypothetical protein PLZ73_10955 [bacterium]|nr:hypothetical protein [bacterium]
MKGLMTAAILGFLFCYGLDYSLGADFDGDGKDDIAVFNPVSGRWLVRGVTRVYFGKNGDLNAVGDYDGDGVADIGIYRSSSGLWNIRGLTRAYYGGSGDSPVSGGGAKYGRDYVRVDEGTGTLSLLPGVTSGSLMVGPEGEAVDVRFNSSLQLGDYWYCRLLWKADRGALYAGYPDASDFTGDELGMASLTVGDRSQATGYCSMAVGEHISSSGTGSAASGSYSAAIGDYSLAMGEWARSANDNSVAIGQWVWAAADNAFVIGKGLLTEPDTFLELYNSYPDSLMVGFNTTTAPALFVDETGVGIDMVGPVRSLHVGDVMRLEPLDAPPDDPGKGDLYFDDGTNKLRCYDGTAWQDCF